MSYPDLLDRAIGDTEPPSTVDLDALIARERGRRRRRWAATAAAVCVLLAAGLAGVPAPGGSPGTGAAPAAGPERGPTLDRLDAAVWAALAEHAPHLAGASWIVPQDETWSPSDGPLWVSAILGDAADDGKIPYRDILTARADRLLDEGAAPVYVATALIPVGRRIDVLDVTIARVRPDSSLAGLDCETNSDILDGSSFACDDRIGPSGELVRSSHNAGPFDVEALGLPVRPGDRQVESVVIRPDWTRVDVWARILVYDEDTPSLPPLDLAQAEALALDRRLSLPQSTARID